MADIARRDPEFGRVDPFGIGSLRHVMDRLFDDTFFRSPLGAAFDEGALALDISRQGDRLVVRASLPGFTKDEVDVQIREGVLAIKAEHREEQEEQGERFFRREWHYGAVSRRVALPGVVSEADVEGELKDGVLTLSIQVPAEAQTKRVELKG